jgi:peroxiredoxin
MAAVVPAQGAAVPGPAPAFTLERLDGQMLSLASFRGSAVILLFWAPW